ncbi:hypothetical protein [Novisyntrophococcus fermenticellae]|uniref:hypothetical protein n=1 Tax=Novisyntrophococcus fermenticellae TaxID=2068655 RepID=UPI001E64CCD1|nr:hypothetical protein [Novisyntrophococcus fermenticellae]
MADKKDYYTSLSWEKKDLVAVFLDIPPLRKQPEKYKHGGGYDMCTAIEEMVQDGKKRGRVKG